ncbi:MAG: HNH endonuclease [Candidatus Dadabacteria bacterium]|nr:MAG: HNH endonuclease [Candidatus Dadabacteria bacterium]
MRAALLLNASYEPLRVVSWKKAVTLVIMGKVEIIGAYDYFIRSVSLKIPAPAVVRLCRYVHVRPQSPPLTRKNLLLRDNYSCQYCNKTLLSSEATIDHVIPRSLGGKYIWENVVVSCKKCNKKKGNKTPEQAGMKLISQPKQPHWLPLMRMQVKGKVPPIWQQYLFC